VTALRPFARVVALAGSCLAALWALPSAQAQEDPEGLRRAFLAAYEQAEAGLPAPLDGDDPGLAGYPLHPYVVGARLRAGMARQATADPALDGRVEAFLARHGQEPVGRWVRRPWLTLLAGRGQWDAFLGAYAQADNPGQALRCQALQARIALDRMEGVAEDAVAEWLTPRSADEACDPVFDWMRSKGLLDETLVERRARLALAEGEAGLARWLARSLPEETARPLQDWAQLLSNPAGSIDALIRSPAAQVEEQALLDGWTRLARNDPRAAEARYRALLDARGGGQALASQLARPLALGMAWSRLDGAVDYFDRIDAADFDETTHEWHVRAALWAGHWKQAAGAIAAMPPALRETSRWRYWEARTAEVAGDEARARTLYEAVIPTDNWFAVLSAARLGRPFEPHQQPARLDAAAADAVGMLPALVRARELFAVGLVPLAQSEWNAGYESLDAPSRRAALLLADRWGWHFQAIAGAAQQGLFDDYELLYPTPFDAEVDAAARRSGVARSLVYAVLRQESLYQPWAVSSAGAVGLMQLLPSTAKITARRAGLPRPTRESLLDPAFNLPLGAETLAGLVERFDGQVLLALAGYNAGPGAVRRWLPPRGMDADVWVENIPYNETRAYVQRIMWHSVVFQWLRDRKPEDATPWLVEVRPADP
jgi:soluble lytic murein transglycosylase